MLRFLRQHFHFGSHETNNIAELRPEDVQDYVNFNVQMCHGFPHRPSCFNVSQELGLLALGTHDGRIRIVGGETTEWSGSVGATNDINFIQFVPNTVSVMLISKDGPCQNIHCAYIERGKLLVNSVAAPALLKRIQAACVLFPPEVDPFLLIGTVSGNLYSFSISAMVTNDYVVYEDLMGNDAEKLDIGKRAVTHICFERRRRGHILVVLNNTWLIIYDVIRLTVIDRIFIEAGVQSVEFSYPVLTSVIIGHSNGSHSIYKIDEVDGFKLRVAAKAALPYGPYAATPTYQATLAIRDVEDTGMVIFSGGMPKASYGDKNAVTVKDAKNHVVFDFDSAVIQFELMHNQDALFVLCEQELVAIDLQSAGWKPFHLPYLYPIHSSPVCCNVLFSNVNKDVYEAIVKAGELQRSQRKTHSVRSWPLQSVDQDAPAISGLSLLITGQENGNITFWNVSSVNMKPLLVYATAKDFEGYFEPRESELVEETTDEEHEEWPPFKRAGLFESLCDDPRFGIQKIDFDCSTGQIAVGGRAGHVVVYELSATAQDVEPLSVIDVDLVGPAPKSTGPQRNASAPLPPRRSPSHYEAGYVPAFATMIQLKPATPIQTLVWHPKHNIAAVGIEFGYLLCDLKRKQILEKHSLLPADDILEIVNNDGQLSRFKSVKKTLRQSFRRRKRTSMRGSSRESARPQDFRPVEREIVARTRPIEFNVTEGKTPPSSVKTMQFSHAAIGDSPESDLLLVGTSGGVLHIHQITPGTTTVNVKSQKVKEIRLNHEAPIVHADVVNGILVIFTEEQIRSYLTPTLRLAKPKYKLTALEGSRIANVKYVHLTSSRSGRSNETLVAVLSTRGEIFIMSPSSLRKLAKIQFTYPADGSGIKSATMAADGTLFWLRPGGSEFQKASIAALTAAPS